MGDGSWKRGGIAGGFDVDRYAEVRLVNKDVNIQEGDMGRGDGPGKSDRVATIEALREEVKGIMTMSPQQEDIINKPEPKVRFRVLLQGSYEEISVGWDFVGTHGCALNLKVMEGVEGDVVVGKDEVSEGYEGIRCRAGGHLDRNFSRAERP